MAIALADLVVAARSGRAIPGLDDPALFLVHVTPERVAMIRTQVERAISDADHSELYELWAETDELDDWIAPARDLLTQL